MVPTVLTQDSTGAVYASDGRPIVATPANPNTAWLREVTIPDLFVFLLKSAVAGLGVGAIFAVPILIIYALAS